MPLVSSQVPSFVPQEKKSARCCCFESLSNSGFIAPNITFYRPYKARTDISLANERVTCAHMAGPRSPGLSHYLHKVIGYLVPCPRFSFLVPDPPWRPASCCRPVIPLSPARIPDWEREEGNFVHGARPRAVAPSSRRMLSPARIPDWEREEGKLHPWRPASCRRPVILAPPARILDCEREEGNFVHGTRPCAVAPSSQDRMTCSFHLSDPSAHCGEDSSTRQTSSSATHSVQ